MSRAATVLVLVAVGACGRAHARATMPSSSADTFGLNCDGGATSALRTLAWEVEIFPFTPPSFSSIGYLPNS